MKQLFCISLLLLLLSKGISQEGFMKGYYVENTGYQGNITLKSHFDFELSSDFSSRVGNALFVGAGYRYHRLSAEIRYVFPRDTLFDDPNRQAKQQITTFTIGYRLLSNLN